MNVKNIDVDADRDELAAVAEAVCATQGVELYWLEYKRSGRRWHLTVYIDKPGGVTIDDCERISRALEPEFDARIEHSYMLIVSSPGLDRELHTIEHFRRAVGEQVKLKLRQPVAGQYVLRGKLVRVATKAEAGAEKIIVETTTGLVELSPAAITRARVVSPLTG